MTFSRLSPAHAARMLLVSGLVAGGALSVAPTPLFAQSTTAPAANTCMLMGVPFTKGATVRMTGERVRCDSNEDGPFWNRDVDGDENENNFIFCIFEDNFFTQGAQIAEMACSGNGNWS